MSEAIYRFRFINIFRHFGTITKHRHEVIRNCFHAGIGWQGLFHDLSKYTPSEFFVGVKYYQGFRSPNEGERDAYGFSKAWMHHKGRNKHHFEYWTDYNPKTKLMSPVKMPTKYVIEMFCDRVAASKIYLKESYTNQSPLSYFENGKKRRIIHPETSALLEELLVMLANKGEKQTFAYIRSLNKKL
ncbi:MAG: catalase [Lachnospiraceae bacterium]|nr:catalase [Lachnospiraceae bacterium]